MPSREEDPGAEHPGPHRPRKGRADVAGQQRADREGESDRDADIAEIERRRMEGQARVLQQRVEAVALERRSARAGERVRGEEQEGVEAERDRRLRGERGDQGSLVQPPLEQRHRRAGDAQGSSPRAASSLRGSPRRRRICRARAWQTVAVLRDQPHREIGAQEQVDQAEEGNDDRQPPGRSRSAARSAANSSAGGFSAAKPKKSCSSDSAAASQSAPRPASAIIPPAPFCARACSHRGSAACNSRHAWRGSRRRRTGRRAGTSLPRRRRYPPGTGPAGMPR